MIVWNNQKIKSWSIVSASIMLIFLFSAFQEKPKPPTLRELIDAAVEEKLREFSKTHRENCKKKVLKRANEIVDSTLFARAKAMRIDTVPKPPKPDKPEKPEILTIEDTTPLKPFFEIIDSTEFEEQY